MMTRSRSRVRETRSQIEREIEQAALRQAESRAEMEDGADEFAERVRDHWKFVEAPVDSGRYAASIHIRKPKRSAGKPPRRQVAASDFKAHMIEFGTGADTKKGSPFGPDTPTPAFAPAQKTAAFFGGDYIGGGVEA